MCTRDPRGAATAVDKITRCAGLLAPDNITPNKPLVYDLGNLAVAIVNPVDGILVHDGAVCLGRSFGSARGWWEMRREPPDGTYTLFRHDQDRLELVTDIFGTRPTWYVHTEDLFLAATSQRALIALLGDFVPNAQATTWMLASGMLFGQPWDARLSRLRGDSRVVLDYRSWRLRLECKPALREPLTLSDEEQVGLLRQAILDTCGAMDLPMDRWLLPLSGGLDSRTILLGLLESGARPRCVTWGPPSSLSNSASDAAIATRLAARLCVEHHFCPIDASAEPLESAMRRFVLASEGQTVDFGGYVDGMATWRGFFEGGEAGIVRGDEPGMDYFGFKGRYTSDLQVRRMQKLDLVSEFPADHPIRSLGLPNQALDPSLKRVQGETLQAWNNRLYEESLFPSQLAPLNTVKSGYIETVSPLLSRRVVEVTRRLPDHLRRFRMALRKAMSAEAPDIPYANEATYPLLPTPFPPDSFVPVITESLSSSEARLVFGQQALDRLMRQVGGIASGPGRSGGMKTVLRAVVPSSVVDAIRPVWPLRLSSRQLVFRAFIVAEMARILARDASSGALAPRQERSSGDER